MTERSSPDSEPRAETIQALPELLREAFLAGEIGVWNILPWAADEIERLRASVNRNNAHGAPEAPGYSSGLTYGDGYKRGLEGARGAPQAAEERRCQKCGRETKGEEALVAGKILCHPCADDVPQASVDKTLAQALYEAECYGIGATSDANQRVILQAAKELAALRTQPQTACREALEEARKEVVRQHDKCRSDADAEPFERLLAKIDSALSRPKQG